MQSREAENASLEAMEPDLSSGMEWEAVQIEGDTVRIKAVSYTHLDVYKRQPLCGAGRPLHGGG